MSRRIKMAIKGIVILSIISFILLLKFYPPSLDNFLFGEREFSISLNDIQFWVKKMPNRNYYRVDGRYLKSPIEDSGGIFFRDEEKIGGLTVLFNPEDNKIYGGGWAEGKERKWELFYLGEGKIADNVFKPIFPEGTKFTFILPGRISISSAPAYYITIHLPNTLRKLEKEELGKGILAEISEEETRVKK